MSAPPTAFFDFRFLNALIMVMDNEGDFCEDYNKCWDPCI